MTLGLIFWILMLLWFIFGLYWNYTPGQPPNLGPLGSHILLFILFLLLGWAEFGPPIRS
jgi:hypothetical protein